MQLFFKPANLSGAHDIHARRHAAIRAANNGDLEVVKLLLEHGADATVYMADRQTPIMPCSRAARRSHRRSS